MWGETIGGRGSELQGFWRVRGGAEGPLHQRGGGRNYFYEILPEFSSLGPILWIWRKDLTKISSGEGGW